MLLLVTLATLVSLAAVTARHQYSEQRWISSTQVELIPPNRKDAYQFSTQLCVSTAPEDYKRYYQSHNIIVKLSQDDCQLPLTNNTVKISSQFTIDENSYTHSPLSRRHMAFFWTKGTKVFVEVQITSIPLRKVGNATLLVGLYETDSYDDYRACLSNDPPYGYMSKKSLTFSASQNCIPYETFTLCILEYAISKTGSQYLCFLTDNSQKDLEFILTYTLTIDQVFYGHDERYPQNQIKTCHLNTSSPCCQPYGALVDIKSPSCVYLISNVSGQNFNLDSARAVPIVIETTGDYSLVYLFTGVFAFELFICLYCMCVCYKHKYPNTNGCVCHITCKWDI